MKKPILQIIRSGVALTAGMVLLATSAFAQDAPPAQPNGPANPDPNAAGRRDRGNRGPGDGANQDANSQRVGRGSFGGLDEKQMELLREATQADSEEMRKLDEKLRASQRELVQAVVAEKYDEKVVREKADAVAKIQTEITMLRAKQVATVVPTLKPEQREQWENSPIALGLLMRGGGFGGGPGNPGFGRGDRGGLPSGPPDGQQPPGGRSFRRNGGDGNVTDQPRRRGGGQ